MRIKALMRQIPVGQGGLMLGSIESSDGHRSFNFCFDCGSVNSEHFAKGLEAVEVDRMDILFISHLDADHVNGIDKLTGRVAVDTVVLPCLDALQATVIACEALEGGTLSLTLASLLGNPSKWFGERGVKRVVFLRREDGDPNAVPGAFIPGPERPRLERIEEIENPTGFVYEIRSNQAKRTPGRRQVAETFVLEAAAEISVLSGKSSAYSHQALSWLLLPYVHPFAATTIDAFRAAVRKVLKVPDDTDLASASFQTQLLRTLTDPASREVLKRCYALISADNNKPSLSLYSGPFPHPPNDWEAEFGAVEHRVQSERVRCGWLSTGDANLRKRETRDPWLRRYEQLLDTVEVFILPHHGSDRSIHPMVTDLLAHVWLVACVGAGRKRHPHPALVSRLRALGQPIIQVTQRRKSEVFLRVFSSPTL